MPHLLFYGPPGTGKTSCMIAIARELYGDNYQNMTLELNASDDRGIDVVRDKIKSFCSTQQLMSRGVKLVILDECDSMTNAAQFALRRIVEKYTTNTRFCLICNYVSKIIPALQSRCTRFRFGPLTDESVLKKLNEVANYEGKNLGPKSQRAIVSLSGGDMRKVLNILESCSLAYDEISEDKVYDVTGRPSPGEIDQIYTWLKTAQFSVAFTNILELKQKRSLAADDVLRQIHQRIMVDPAFNDRQKLFIVERMSQIEYRLAQGCTDKAQIASAIGAFVEARKK